MGTEWQIGPVKLANGEEAFIDAINEWQDDSRYTGRARNHAGHWVAWGWDANGRHMYAEKSHPYDLAPPPKKTVRVRAWLVVWRQLGTVSVFYDQSNAVLNAKKHGFALIEIDREVTEGEGL